MSEYLRTHRGLRAPLAATLFAAGALALAGCGEEEKGMSCKQYGAPWSSNMKILNTTVLAEELHTTSRELTTRGTHGMAECNQAFLAKAIMGSPQVVSVTGFSEDCLAIGFADDSGFNPSNPDFTSNKIWAVCLRPEAAEVA